MGITIHWQLEQKRPANRVRHRTDTVDVAVRALNRMLELGRPTYVRII